MGFLKSALQAIPAATANVLGLVAFLALVIAYVVVALRVSRFRQLQGLMAALPEEDRIKAVKDEMGKAQLARGISPDDWLRERRMTFYLSGAALLCVTAFLIVLVVFYRPLPPVNPGPDVKPPPPPRPPTVNVTLDAFDRPARGEGTAGAGRESGGDVLRYVLGREGDVVKVGYSMDYLDRLRAGEEVQGLNFDHHPFHCPPPRLSVQVNNHGPETLSLTEVVVEVLESKVNTEPVLVVRDLSINALEFSNEGWGEVIDPVVTFGVSEVTAGDEVPLYPVVEHTAALPSFTDGRSLPLTDAVPERLLDDETGMAAVKGSIAFGPKSARRTFRFRTRVWLQVEARQPNPPSYSTDVMLRAGVVPQEESRPLSQTVAPGEVDNVALGVASDRSARFRLRVSVRTDDKGLVPGNELILETFVPRSQSRFFKKGGSP